MKWKRAVRKAGLQKKDFEKRLRFARQVQQQERKIKKRLVMSDEKIFALVRSFLISPTCLLLLPMMFKRIVH